MERVSGHVADRWHVVRDGKKVRTDRYGRGLQWQTVWHVYDEQGIKRERTEAHRTKVDAEAHLATIKADQLRRVYIDPSAGKITFKAYAEQWRSAAVHRQATRDRTESLLRLHVYPALGELPIGGIRPSAVQSFVSTTAAVLGPSTLRTAYSVLSAVFAAAVRDQVIPVSPCQGVRLPEARRRRVEPPDLEVLDALTAALPERFRTVVALVAGAGLRQAEVFGLEVDQVDFLRGRQVRVEQQLVSPSTGRPHLGPPKTSESERVIPVAQVTLDAVAAYLAAFPAAEVELEDRTDPRTPRRRSAQLLFTLDNGRPVARNVWSEIWMPAARAAGLPPRTGLHVVRHWYASALIRHGASVKAVQARLGHASAAVTLDVYSHLWPDDDDRTREAVVAALGKAGGTDQTRTGAQT